MGSVWIARHDVLDAEVAVKFLHRIISDSKRERALERFRREASIAAKIRCPHAAQTFDSGVLGDGTPFIVMELLEGENLADRLKRVQQLTLKQALTLMQQASKVLSRAHALGIVHRDIKPANMFLVDSGYDIFLKLLDFGLAKELDATRVDGITVTGALLGSPAYMSPEQIVDPKRIDHRCDLWSLAVVMYRALTGRLPFAGNTLGETILAVTEHDMLPASSLRPSLPAGFDAWFAKAFHRDIDQRFANSLEMCTALEAAAKSRQRKAQRRTQSRAAHRAACSTIVPPPSDAHLIPLDRLSEDPSYLLSDEGSRPGWLERAWLDGDAPLPHGVRPAFAGSASAGPAFAGSVSAGKTDADRAAAGPISARHAFARKAPAGPNSAGPPSAGYAFARYAATGNPPSELSASYHVPIQPSWITQLSRRRSHYLPLAAILLGLGGAGAVVMDQPMMQPAPVMAEEGMLSVPEDLGSSLQQGSTAKPRRYDHRCAGRARGKCLQPPSWPDAGRQ